MCDFYEITLNALEKSELLKKVIKLGVGETTTKDWGTNVQI